MRSLPNRLGASFAGLRKGYRSLPLPPPFEARLETARALSPSVRELAFVRCDGQPLIFEPGQWVNALLPILPDGGRAKRSYSIASAPDGSTRFELAVTRVQGGPGSTWLHSAEPGAVLTFTGPQGFFTRPPQGSGPSLMIATGTGVTPMRSMMRSAIASGSRAPMWLLLGVRHEEDLLYGDEFRAMTQANPFVRFEPTLSQPRADWHGRRGYVQTHVRELWEALGGTLGTDAAPHVYVCGLQRMVGSVRQMCRAELGAGREQVHSERYD